MARSLRLKTLLHFSKPIPFSSLSSSLSNDFIFYNSNQSQPNIIEKALYLLTSCNNSNHLIQMHSHLLTTGIFQHPSFSGRLLKLSTNLCTNPCYTFLIFKFISFPDAFCVNTVIKNYCISSCYEKALSFYVSVFKDGIFWPNSFTFPSLFSACGKLGCGKLGEMCHGQVVKFGVDSVLPVTNSLIHFYACFGEMDVARKVFDEMVVRDVVTWNTVIDGYAKVGEMDLAHKFFDVMVDRNVVSWNVMMTGYLKFRNPGNVMKLFREMMVMGAESNDTTVVNVLAACGRSSRLKEGRSVHGFRIKRFLKFSLIVDTAMVDMYSKCGRLELGQVIFDSMPKKNLVSWNVIVLGHCIHGNPTHGIDLYEKMVDTSKGNSQNGRLIVPDEVTFVGVLCACARKGMLIQGQNYFSQMTDVFKLKPNFAHYWCMANLLGGVGLMQEAMDLLKNIPMEDDVSPESSSWAGLLGSCRFLGDFTLGEKIAKHLVQLDPENFSYYNLLVNVYNVAGQWEEVARTKEIMKQRGIKKGACCNLKDLKEIVYKAGKDLKLSDGLNYQSRRSTE